MYVGRKYKTGPYVRYAIEKLTSPGKIGKKPEAPKNDDGTDSADVVDLAIFKKDVKAYSLLQREFQSDLQKAFNLILGQCSDDMETKIKAHDFFH